jgi:Cu+-exporting ATPase
VSAALGRAAQLGVLFKSGEALERAARIDRVILDKTGTLTEGRLEVARVLCAEGVDEARLVATAASAVGASRHPVALGIRRAAELRGLALTASVDARTLPGLGIAAGRWRVGSRALLASHRVVVPERSNAASAEAGVSLAFVAEDDRALGALALADLRARTRAAAQRLSALGLRPALLSGITQEPCVAQPRARVSRRGGRRDARCQVARVHGHADSAACWSRATHPATPPRSPPPTWASRSRRAPTSRSTRRTS